MNIEQKILLEIPELRDQQMTMNELMKSLKEQSKICNQINSLQGKKKIYVNVVIEPTE